MIGTLRVVLLLLLLSLLLLLRRVCGCGRGLLWAPPPA